MKSQFLFKLLVLCPLVALFTSATALSALSAPKEHPSKSIPALSDKINAKDGETIFGDNEVLAKLDLGNKSKLSFVKVGSGNFGVLEEYPKGARSISSVPGVTHDMPIADLFYAFSKPGTPIPRGLLQSGKRARQFQKQGWARQFIAKPQLSSRAITSGFCNNTNLTNFLNHSEFNGYTKYNRPDQVPRNSVYFAPYTWNTAFPGVGVLDFYHYVIAGQDGSTSYNVDRYLSTVSVCAIDVTADASSSHHFAHPSFEGSVNISHIGPEVAFEYREKGETTWKTASSKDFAANEAGKHLAWRFNPPSQSPGIDWDWRTRIYEAGADDSFDIGHAKKSF